MNGITTIARKELRSVFLSPVALIFLGVFLVAALFDFFFLSKFFARNLADLRPLFGALPVLLIFLVAALTMRQWSEEQKSGTLEVLLTLPLRTRDLVLGKFFAGVLLVGLALLLTLPLPITVSMLGDLDWGPVVGGYVAALLLGSTYLALGLCISALTDNQIVALLVTGIIGGLMYVVGGEQVAGTIGVIFGNEAGEIMRSLGTGSRFASIERGVLDLRDLFYYGSLTAFFLSLNGYFLETKRMEKQPADGNSRRGALMLGVALVGLNVVLGNLWLAPVTSARADLTADGEYSISPVTEELLARLDEPLLIAGYFSEKTHPKLAPLVPRIRDFLEEYEVRGAGNVRVEFHDPSRDEAIEEEIKEQYGIDSIPLRVSSRTEEAVVNSFFHILVKYGDTFEVLSFGDLIEVHADESDVVVRLRNLEYDITRAIKKASEGFSSIEAVLARNEANVKLTAYVTPGQLPPEFAEVPARIKKVADELAEKSGGRLAFEQIDPSGDQALAEQIAQTYGFRPLAADLFGQQTFYLYLLLEAGERAEPLFPQGDMSEADLRATVEAGVQRLTPGFVKTIGLLTSKEAPTMPDMPGAPNHPVQADYKGLERALAADFEVKQVELKDGAVPGDIDVLIVGKPGPLDPKQQFAIDQYLMRGGAVIALAGAYRIKPERTGINAIKEADPLFELLETYGVKVDQAFVMDPQNTAFPMPVREQRGPFVFERVELLPYPFFIDVRPDGFNREHPALAGVPSLAMTWASPVRFVEGVEGREGLDAQVLVRSSDESWVRRETVLEPDLKQFPEVGFGAPGDAERDSIPLAVTLVGTLPSHFAEKASPLFEPGAEPTEEASDGDRTGRTLKQSTPDARLVVVGSSEFVGDLVTQLGGQIGGGSYRGNPVLLRNLIDWTLEDTDLLQIRSAGAFARTLKSMDDSERNTYEVVNYAVVLLALGGVLLLTVSRRRLAKPIPLTGTKGGVA